MNTSTLNALSHFIRKNNLSNLTSSLSVQSRHYKWKSGIYGHKQKERKKYIDNKCIFDSTNNNYKLYPLVSAYREHGHKKAKINPISLSSNSVQIPELELERYGLHLNETYSFVGLIGNKTEGTVNEAVKWLEEVYCGKLSAEFMYLEDIEEREWFRLKLEAIQKEELDAQHEKTILKELIKSQVFENFLAAKFVTLKRYSGEGAECSLVFFLELFDLVSKDNVSNIVIAAHHRGRLSFMTGLLHMPPQLLFRKTKGLSEFPEGTKGRGDVISHLCPSATLLYNNKELNVRMTNLPSHLEAVCPASLGQTRGIQQLLKEGDYSQTGGQWGDQVLNIQVHGDASIIGQGVSQESLIMSCLPHFYVGGSIHLIINNQVGFTTPPYCGRGTRYASDLAKIISAPVLHVNGDFPNEMVKAARIAVEYQRKFRKNVFIDLNCFRRWGHNEVDDPTFSNPGLYNIINKKSTVPDAYGEYLVNKNIVTKEEIKSMQSEHYSFLNQCLDNVESFVPELYNQEAWSNYCPAPNAITSWDTGVDIQLLKFIGEKSVEIPEAFNIHPGLLKNHITNRLSKLKSGQKFDWATAEALAIGSLLYNGYNVRISGQDVARGTFSHRHAAFIDQVSDDIYIPLNNLSSKQTGYLEVANSLLSEEAVLGFEYGLSSVLPTNLVIWEAQFGDFFNGAQIQIDTYVTSGEDKWFTKSGIVLLLPHGYDGAGPEHSSCRVERFLQLSNSSEEHVDGEDVNIHIANPTTPAQYFHLLRRQMIRNYRKPLIIVGPKIILRSPDATSSLEEMGPNTCFTPVLGDHSISDDKKVRRVIFVSGKHYYTLVNHREKMQIKDTAIIRVEELSPFPTQQLMAEMSKYKNAQDFIWSQEEPQNMGSWTFFRPRFQNLLGRKIKYTGRQPSSSPAVGIGEIHNKEAQQVVQQAFKF